MSTMLPSPSYTHTHMHTPAWTHIVVTQAHPATIRFGLPPLSVWRPQNAAPAVTARASGPLSSLKHSHDPLCSQMPTIMPSPSHTRKHTHTHAHTHSRSQQHVFVFTHKSRSRFTQWHSSHNNETIYTVRHTSIHVCNNAETTCI